MDEGLRVKNYGVRSREQKTAGRGQVPAAACQKANVRKSQSLPRGREKV